MKPGNPRIRVLVADDSATALACICKYLEFEGFDVVGTASDGLQLVHEAGRLRPQLVLTDLNMPRVNGLEATAELRRSFPDLRIVVVTELSSVFLRHECARSGADGFIEKTELSDNLMKEVRRLFPACADID